MSISFAIEGAIAAGQAKLESYQDPISRDIMLDPVSPQGCRHIFDRSSLEESMARRTPPVCPMDEREIVTLIPQEELRREIEAFITENPLVFEGKTFQELVQERAQEFDQMAQDRVEEEDVIEFLREGFAAARERWREEHPEAAQQAALFRQRGGEGFMEFIQQFPAGQVHEEQGMQDLGLGLVPVRIFTGEAVNAFMRQDRNCLTRVMARFIPFQIKLSEDLRLMEIAPSPSFDDKLKLFAVAISVAAMASSVRALTRGMIG